MNSLPDLPADKAIKKILIIKWSAMGDIIISTALFEDIRRAFPAAQIDLNILPPWGRLFQNDPRFNEIINIDLRQTEKGPKGFWRWVCEVRRRNYDLIVDLQSNDRSRWLMTALHLTGVKIPWRLGNHRRYPYNLTAEPPKVLPIHSFPLQQRALASAGIPTLTPRPVLHVDVAARQRVTGFLEEYALSPDGYALFLPGCQAAGYLKRWGADNYTALAELLNAQGLKVVIVGGPDEMDECEEICTAVGQEWLVNLCGKTEIVDIVPLAEQARLIVGNDTGTAHVASAADRPMLVICGPTDPRRVKPIGDNVQALQAIGLDCINCYCKKPCAHHSCMKQISAAQVLAKLREMGAV
ncbi:lipopolysaccharide heptosyltransferase II [Deltaproteobacteria bacterium]|nr:lipopolysaccharide heptosyltransferase II [Deltaproteobacteria bacterium]